MLIRLEPGSAVPIYQQLRDRIVEAIAARQLQAGDPLPSTRGLAAQLSINFHTVNKAYDLLRREGFVRLTHRSGAVVVRDGDSGPPDAGFLPSWQARARTLFAEALAHGVRPDELLDRCRSTIPEATRP